MFMSLLPSFVLTTQVGRFRYAPVLNKSPRLCNNGFHVVVSSCATNDLLIIGAGDLGLLVGANWLRRHPEACVFAETRSKVKHERIRQAGLEPLIAGDGRAKHVANVLFCVPPPKQPGYLNLVREGILRTLNSDSRFVFASSTAVHGDQAIITERTPTSYKTERGKTLTEAEELTLNAPVNSAVVRFSGLYSLHRGPHAFWVDRQIQRVSERGTANMIHRVDAANAVNALLDLPDWPDSSDSTFLVSSADSLSARQICDAARLHPEYENKMLPTVFSDIINIRKCDSSWTRRTLNWKPKWDSLLDFMREDGKRARAGLPSGRLID